MTIPKFSLVEEKLEKEQTRKQYKDVQEDLYIYVRCFPFIMTVVGIVGVVGFYAAGVYLIPYPAAYVIFPSFGLGFILSGVGYIISRKNQIAWEKKIAHEHKC